MFIESRGCGPAVVFIPGLGCDHTMYAPQVRDLSNRMQCVSLDVLGCGASPPLGDLAVSEVLDVQAEAIVQAVRGIGVERAHVVGISYGGVLVQTLMLRHRDLLASAVICDSLCDTRPRTRREAVLLWPARLQPTMLRLLPRAMLTATVRSGYRRWPQAGQALADTLATARMRDLVLQRRAVNAVRYEELLAGCTTPTLCLVGDHSLFAVDMMRRTHRAIPGSQFAVIPGSFDPSSLCQPQEFTRRIEAWVQEQEG